MTHTQALGMQVDATLSSMVAAPEMDTSFGSGS